MWIRFLLVAIAGLFVFCACSPSQGEEYQPLTKEEVNELRKRPSFYQEGVASFYNNSFHGKPTSTGALYDTTKLTAAHKRLPLNSKLRVINIRSGKEVLVTINDRGPFRPNRIIDLSKAAAKEVGLTKERGITRVLLFKVDD